MSAVRYRLTRRGLIVSAIATWASAIALGLFGGYIIATWFELRG